MIFFFFLQTQMLHAAAPNFATEEQYIDYFQQMLLPRLEAAIAMKTSKSPRTVATKTKVPKATLPDQPPMPAQGQ